MGKLFRAWSVVSGLLLAVGILPSQAAAAGYSIVKLVNGIDRPDLPCCVHFYIFYTPVISGGKVAFLSRNGVVDGVWSGDIATRTLTKLVGLETAAPGGVGNFTAFYGGTDTPLSIGGNTVTFFASDSGGHFGIYSVPVTGGPVRRVATTATLAPDGQPFQDLRRATTNGAFVTFYGRTSAHFTGIYRATTAGRQLSTVIDNGTRLDARDASGTLTGYYGGYYTPVYAKTAIHFFATGVGDPSNAPNAIMRGSGAGAIDEADNLTRLQSLPAGHVRVLAFSAAALSNGFGFIADEPSAGYAGVFKGQGANFALKFATTLDTAPGTLRKFQTFTALSYDDSGAAFVATRSTATGSDQSIYFSPGPGQAVQRVASGAKYYFPTIGDRALNAGKIVFMDGTSYADRVYVAVPIP